MTILSFHYKEIQIIASVIFYAGENVLHSFAFTYRSSVPSAIEKQIKESV